MMRRRLSRGTEVLKMEMSRYIRMRHFRAEIRSFFVRPSITRLPSLQYILLLSHRCRSKQKAGLQRRMVRQPHLCFPVIPDGAFVPQETQNILNEFSGKVSYNVDDAVPVIKADNSGLRAMHRKTENAEIFCLFNESNEIGDYRISFSAENGYLLDLTNGKLQRFKTENGILNLSLAVGETAVVLLTEELFEAEDIKIFKEKHEISNQFMLRKDTELIFNENGFDNVKHTEKASPVTLGDWSNLIGSEYSGSCIYETAFALADDKVGKEGEIDLGEVHFLASVYLNNQFLGTAWASPYRLKIPCGVLDKNNTLKITVTNTSANRYIHTDYFDKWKPEELSPYFEVEKEYAKDFVSGGLYGPVELYTG